MQKGVRLLDKVLKSNFFMGTVDSGVKIYLVNLGKLYLFPHFSILQGGI